MWIRPGSGWDRAVRCEPGAAGRPPDPRGRERAGALETCGACALDGIHGPVSPPQRLRLPEVARGACAATLVNGRSSRTGNDRPTARGPTRPGLAATARSRARPPPLEHPRRMALGMEMVQHRLEIVDGVGLGGRAPVAAAVVAHLAEVAGQGLDLRVPGLAGQQAVVDEHEGRTLPEASYQSSGPSHLDETRRRSRRRTSHRSRKQRKGDRDKGSCRRTSLTAGWCPARPT